MFRGRGRGCWSSPLWGRGGGFTELLWMNLMNTSTYFQVKKISKYDHVHFSNLKYVPNTPGKFQQPLLFISRAYYMINFEEGKKFVKKFFPFYFYHFVLFAIQKMKLKKNFLNEHKNWVKNSKYEKIWSYDLKCEPKHATIGIKTWIVFQPFSTILS